jgi:nucleoside-diphosphate-sugar epimerase
MNVEYPIEMAGRALVTGLAGFTGHYMAAELESRGYQVFGLGSPGSGPDEPGVDLRDAEAVRDAVAAIRPEVVIHLAAVAFVAHGDVNDIYTSNIVGTRNLLAALASMETSVDKVLLVSSANIYGNSTISPLREDSPANPENDYAVSKYAMELMARQWRDDLPIIVSRPFNYTGVGQSKSFLLPKIVDHFARGERRIELGNTDVYRDFSDVRSVVDAYARLLAGGEVGHVYNVCSGEAHSIHQILGILASVAGYDIEVEVNPAFVRANEVKRLLGSNGRLVEVIGDLREIPLEDTLHWMYHKQKEL